MATIFSQVRALLKEKDFKVFSRPYELNIVGLRSNSTIANRFDDEIHVFYMQDNKKWAYHVYKATTDPGTYWLENPSSPKGTAILAEGQNLNAYAIGLHNGKYKALVQVRPVTVIRDYERKAVLDFINGRKDNGLFGINIHHARAIGKTKYINKYSAGCQVFENAIDFKEFLGLCEKHKILYGNEFTYTLIDKRAVNRLKLKKVSAAIGFFVLMLGFLFNNETKGKRK